MWYRIFCRDEAEVKPAEMLSLLGDLAGRVTPHFKGDDLGWTAAEFLVEVGTPIFAERYLTKEDGLRDDLNTWAGWLETQEISPHHVMLMERVIQTQQMITLRKPIDHPNEGLIDEICTALSQAICQKADGIYQNEDAGWYSAAGEELLKEY